VQRVKNRDSSVSEVELWESKTFDFPVGQKHEVFTRSLGGCTAVAVLSLHKDGMRSISLSHFPPTIPSQAKHLRAIENSLTTNSHYGPDLVQHEVIIVAPENGSNWDGDLVEGIRTTLRPRIQDEPKILRYPARPGGSAFILTVPENGAVRYGGFQSGDCKF
jgi:hypothetical protein